VVDIRTFQGLSPDSKAKAARVCRNSLTLGGEAVFVLVNVREDHHDQIKEIIRREGFHLADRKVDGWFWGALRDSGIPYNMVDKRPCVQKDDERYSGAKGELKLKRDQKRLDGIARDYQKRLHKQFKRLRQVSEETNTRIADLRFWTG
jgi:hypothetical protein